MKNFQADNREYWISILPGKRGAYSDRVNEWEVETTEPDETKIAQAMFNELHMRPRWTRGEWKERQDAARKSGDWQASMDAHFRGYYTLTKVGEGKCTRKYIFATVDPFND